MSDQCDGHWVSYVLRIPIVISSTCAWEAGHDQTLAPPSVCVRRMSGVVACILAYVVGGWRNVYAISEWIPESHNPESSGLDILTVTRNPSEQLSETNAEGSERENRKAK